MSETAPASCLTLDIERTADAVIVCCHGKLIAGVTKFFTAEVGQLVPGTKRLVLDLSDLQHTDSMGLGALVQLYVSAKSEDCSLELMHLSKQIRHLLGLTNLFSVFTVIGESGVKFM